MTRVPTGRFLRSKRLRSLLWIAAGGRCARCGEALGEDWHADHAVPWSINRRTNVHDLIALCARCNAAKGDLVLRRFQRELLELGRDIANRTNAANRVILDVTPGAGKSTAPIILASKLIPRCADRVCWVVPRTALQEQGETSFLEPFFRRLFGHGLEIRQSTNDVNPCRDKIGFVTTYQAVMADGRSTLRDAFDRGERYILVLDESHHVMEGSPLHRALQPMVDRAAFVVLMSGTFERGDRRKIAFLPYRRDLAVAGEIPDLVARERTAVIRYGLKDALAEHAIKELHFQHLDGRVGWMRSDGAQHEVASIAEATRTETPAAIFTALNTAYAHQLLEQAIADWRDRQRINPAAKLLVVAASIASAKTYLTWMHKLGVARCAIATSDDSEAAVAVITRYKLGNDEVSAIEALVTVAMAYEGLDVPAITHIASLTHIRSRPWIWQMLARAVRLGDAYGVVFCPDDTEMRDIIRAWRDAAGAFVPDVVERDGGGERAEQDAPDGVIPLHGEATTVRASDLASGQSIDAGRVADLRELAALYGIHGSPVALERFADALQNRGRVQRTPRPAADAPVITASIREKALLKAIASTCKRIDRVLGHEPGATNKRVVLRFGKSRLAMGEDELVHVARAVETWLAEAQERGVGVDGGGA